MKKRTGIFIIIILTFAFHTKAQNPLSLYYLENIPQTTLLNPAMAPRANFYLGIPGINTIYTSLNTNIASGIVQEQSNGYVFLGQDGFDYTDLYKDIGDAANFSTYQTITPLMLGFRTKNGYFTFSWTEKLGGEISVPKDLFRIMDEGYTENTTYDLSKSGSDAKYYREISLGYSFNISGHLKLGIHAKFLQGLAAIKSEINKIKVDNGINNTEVTMDGAVYMSAPVYVSYDENGLPSFDSIPSDMNTLIDKGIFNFSNPGFAIDLGMVYSKNKLELSGAVNDLGFILWKGDDLNTFYANGSYSFDGLNEDSTDNSLGDLIDSIKVAVNFTHGNETFNTGIGPKIYFGARYKFNHYFSMGLLSRTVISKYITRQDFNVSANLNLYHILTTSFNYTMSINGRSSLGAGVALRFGPLQLYTAMDYIPYKVSKDAIIADTSDMDDPTIVPVMPDKFSNFNIMFGVNILFGANGYHDKPMIEPSPLF